MPALRGLKYALLVAVCGITIAACGSDDDSDTATVAESSTTAESSGDTAIGVVAIDLQNTFFARMKKAGEQAAKDYGISSNWQSAEGSLEKQVSIIENMVRQKVGAILVDPVDAKGIAPAVSKAVEAGIPVIAMGNKVTGNGNHNTLYPDAANAATDARALATAITGSGTVGLLVGSRGNYVSDTREKGFIDEMKKANAKVKVVAEPTDWDTTKATDIVTTWMTSHSDLKGFACISDSLCLAAQEAAKAAGKELPFVGTDGDAELHPFLQSGQMKLDILTGAERVGYWNVAVGARLAKGADLPNDLFMPTYFVSGQKTADEMKTKGVEIESVTPEEATEKGQAFAEEFGPDKPDTAMTVGK